MMTSRLSHDYRARLHGSLVMWCHLLNIRNGSRTESWCCIVLLLGFV